MRIIFKVPFCDDDILIADNEFQATLGAIIERDGDHKIDRVLINDVEHPEWYLFVGGDDDEVEVFVGNPQGTGAEVLVAYAIATLLSFAFSFILQLLLPAPKRPNQNRAQPAFGVAGITNTIAPGTVKFLVYGKRRVFGHIILSRTDLTTPIGSGLYRKMEFKVVYFMGAGPIKHITDPKINKSNLLDFEGTSFDIRLGTQDQTIFEGFDYVHQTYTVQQTIPTPSKEDATANEYILYTTKGPVDKLTISISFGGGIFGIRQKGSRAGTDHDGWYEFEIGYKKNSETAWNTQPRILYRARTRDACFAQHEIEFTSKARYDIRIKNTNIRIESQQSGPAVLYNVMETQFITTNYPGSSMMMIEGVGTAKIQSLDSLETSGLVCGRIIPVWDPDHQMIIRNWTQSRAWICRDILLDPEHCLGSSVSEAMVDDGSLVQALLSYERDLVNGYAGLEERDHCDVILNEFRPGWDIIKNLTFEGDTRFLPLGGKLTYVIDRGGEPLHDYADPGNILQDSVEPEFGRSDKQSNTVKATFANEDDDYKEVPAKLTRRAGLGTDYERSDDATYISITRESQVARRMRRDVERTDLVERFWNFLADRKSMQSVPLDPIRLSYRTPKDRKGVSGFVCDGSTTTTINLDRLVTLEASKTYSISLFHKKDRKIELRTVSTPAGKWGKLVVSSPFSAVSTGDIIMIGVPTEHWVKGMIDSVSRTREGFYQVKISEMIDSVYEPDDPLPRVTELTAGASEVSQVTQQPIIVQGVGNVPQSRAEFKVAPGFDHYRGTTVDTTATHVDLPSNEPDVDDFFNDYYIEVPVGSGIRIKITDYIGASRRAILERDPGVTGAQTYRLSSSVSGRFNGFSLERAPASSGPWSFLSSTTTTQLNVIGFQSSTEWFRITPISARVLENTIGRWVFQLSAGDSILPAAPVEVTLESIGKQVFVQVSFAYPLARDTWRVNIQVNRTTADGTNIDSKTVDISQFRNEDNATGENIVSVMFDLTAEANGTLVFARANIEDYFNNVSAWVDSEEGTELSADEPADLLGPGSDTADIVVTNTVIETVVGSITIPGGGLGIDGTAMMRLFFRITDTVAANDATVTFRLKFKNITIATMVCRTSNLTSSLGTEIPWQVDCHFCAKGTNVDQLGHLIKHGIEIPAAGGGGSIEVPYDAACTTVGLLPASTVILGYPPPREIRFAEDMPLSRGVLETAATASTVLSIRKNGVEFATLTFGAGQTVGVFDGSAAVITASDVLTVVTPATPDATAAGLRLGLAGVRDGESASSEGPTTRLVRGTINGQSIETSGELQLTVQLSIATPTLAVVRELEISDFYVNDEEV